MDAVIIGVSNRTFLWKYGRIQQEKYKDFIKSYAQFLSKWFDNLITVPDDGVYSDIALKFGEIKGKKPIAYYPDRDDFYGIDHIKGNFPKFKLKPIKGDWYKLNAELTKQALIIISLGFSPGVLIEGSFIKYHQKYGKLKDPKLKYIHWFIDERCIEQRLPKSFEEEISNIFYFSDLVQFEELLRKKQALLKRNLKNL